MGRPSRRSIRVATPERLLDAAEVEFAGAGFAAARLEDIAARAGISRPSLLHHFPSKQQLYAAAVTRSFERLGTALAAALAAPGSFAARLEALVVAFAAFLDAHPSLAGVILRELLASRGPGRELLLHRVAPLVSAVERRVRRAGRGSLRAGLPVRAALLQVASDLLLRAAAGSLREPLWGPGQHARALARSLFLADGGPGAKA